LWCSTGDIDGRVAYERDMKIMNAATFTVQREDHTVGNVLRMYGVSPPCILPLYFLFASF
jgi:DUF1365 family protein